MALDKKSTIDKIEVLENGAIQVRRNNQIIDTVNGEVVASKYERWVLCPGDDVSAQDPKVQDIAKVTWTPEVISAFEQAMLLNSPTVSA